MAYSESVLRAAEARLAAERQQHDEQNRRRIHLTLTDAARPVVDEAQQAQARVIAQMMAGVTPEENEILCRVVQRINHNVSLVLDESHPRC